MSGFFVFIIKTFMLLIAVFLVLLVLVQRGRGGGLAGALGGMGGQSAFGTKAGDLFTRITIVVAAIWILLCAGAVKYFKPEQQGNKYAEAQLEGAGPGAAPAPPAGEAPQ